MVAQQAIEIVEHKARRLHVNAEQLTGVDRHHRLSVPGLARTQYAPYEEELGGDFIAWLKKGFGWLFWIVPDSEEALF